MTFAERFPATQHADFRRLWAGATLSSIALWTLFVANTWVVFDLSDSSTMAGVAAFAYMAGYLLSPIGGAIADRVERRQLAVVLRVLATALALGLFVLAVAGMLEVWIIIAFTAALGTVSAVRDPSDAALLGNVVPIHHVASAVTLSSMSRHGSRALGPLLGAPLLAGIGAEGVYALGALLSIAAVFSLRRVETVSRGGAAPVSQIFSSLGEGLSYIRHTRPVLALFVLVTVHCALTMSYDGMLPGFARDELGGGAGFYTMLTVGSGFGALFGTAFLSATTNSPRGGVLLWATLASGATPVLLGLSSILPVAIPATLLVGGSQAMMVALAGVLLQETVPDALRGRVMSLYGMSAGGIMAFANLGFGWAADVWSAPAMFVVPGIAFVAFTIAMGVFAVSIRATFRTGRLPSLGSGVAEAAGG
jgi:MFS family permease